MTVVTNLFFWKVCTVWDGSKDQSKEKRRLEKSIGLNCAHTQIKRYCPWVFFFKLLRIIPFSNALEVFLIEERLLLNRLTLFYIV